MTFVHQLHSLLGAPGPASLTCSLLPPAARSFLLLGRLKVLLLGSHSHSQTFVEHLLTRSCARDGTFSSFPRVQDLGEEADN